MVIIPIVISVSCSLYNPICPNNIINRITVKWQSREFKGPGITFLVDSWKCATEFKEGFHGLILSCSKDKDVISIQKICLAFPDEKSRGLNASPSLLTLNQHTLSLECPAKLRFR